MTPKKNKKPVPEDLNGLSERHVAQIIRSKMKQKDHGDDSKYNKKDKSWKKDLENN